jgi:transcriptional regulator GlxA family with amidase domain
MLEKSASGILFSKETTQQLTPRIVELNQKHGFDSMLELMSILHDLSISRNMKLLSSPTFNNMAEQFSYNSRRIEKTLEYVNKNFDKPVTLGEVAKLANMSEVSFSRFFKQRTSNTFMDCLTEIRLGHATRMLIDTTTSIAEVANQCGFNNISNFNRTFKKRKNCTPKEFRESFSGTRIFI